MGRQLPASVTTATWVQLGVITLGGAIALMTVVQEDVLLDAWAARQTADVEPPAFVPVTVVLFFTYALLAALLLVFFRGGHPSARLSLAGLAVFFAFTMYVLIRQDPPTLFVVMAAASVLLNVVLVGLMWHRDTSAFLRGATLAADSED